MITKQSAFMLTLVAALFVSVTPITGYAQETEDVQLPDPGVLPDSPFYGLKKAFESIGTGLTFGEDSKAQRAIEIAQIRLAEVQAMAKVGKPEFVDSLLQEYSQGLDNANNIASSLEDDKRAIVTERVATATSRHLSVFDDVLERVPSNATDSVIAAREHSMKGNMQALRALAAENPERAAEITVQVAENRASKLREATEEGDSEDAIQAAEEYLEYEQFGNEISVLAREAGKNATRVQEIVSLARTNHLTVLERVYEQVPEEAKPTIERAIADSEERLDDSETDTTRTRDRAEQQANDDMADADEESSDEKQNGRGNATRSSDKAQRP